MMPRFYFQDPLKPHAEILLTSPILNHIQALRCQSGDMITLFDGKGAQISAKITEITKKYARVQLLDDLKIQEAPKLKLHLGQALCRFDRMDLILQKAVELNATEITPIYAERSQGRLKGAQLERKMQHWQDAIISACEQCNQNYLPTLHAPVSLTDWLNQVQADLKLQFALEKASSLKTYKSATQSIALLIGPEGGFTEQEVSLADQNDFIRITLGERILRVETAAILALGLVNFHFN